MTLRRIFLILALICSSSIYLSAQNRSDRIKPRWMTREVPTQQATHLFEKGFGDGATLNEARQHCFLNLTTKLEHERGIIISSKISGRSQTTRDNHTLSKDFSMECIENGKEITLMCRTVDEYWERMGDRYGCTLLYSVANTAVSTHTSDNMSVTARYGVRGAWRSAIVPGWGQFHKGSNLKGGLILGGCAILAAGIVFTENQRSDYMSKISRTHNAQLIRNYSTKASHISTGRNICIGAAAALYLYNLIDAIAAPGARRVINRHRKGIQNRYYLTPSLHTDGLPVISALLTF